MLIERAEIWSDYAAGGGAHQASIPRDDLMAAVLDEDLEGKDRLDVKLRRASAAWPEISGRRVLRLIFTDGTVREFRIEKAPDGRDRTGAETGSVIASGSLLDLGNGIVRRTEQTGRVRLVFTLLSHTRQQLVTKMLENAPTFFAAGTISASATVVDAFTFDGDTPLRALQELAQIEGLELAVRRNGDTSYLVDLIDQVGAGAVVPEFRYRKNLIGVKRTPDLSDMANRIWPIGGGDGMAKLTIGRARWRVTAIISSTIFAVDENPILQDGHLGGDYVEGPTTTVQISSTDAALQRVTTAAAHNLSVDDYVRFGADISGTELAFVEDAAQQAVYGTIDAVIEESDLPPVDNLVQNAALRNFTAGNPDDWNVVGAPTTSQNVDERYTRIGGASARVQAGAVGQGLSSDPIPISPSQPDVFYSVLASLYVVSGEVLVYIVHSTEGRFPEEGAEAEAFTSETDRFIELGIAGKELPAGNVQIFVVSRNGAAEFYLDGAMFLNSAGLSAFFEGRAANKLWARGLDALRDRAGPRMSYEIDAVDLTTIDPATFPYDALTLGGTVFVEDEILQLQLSTRLLRIRRELIAARTLGLELSNRPLDLIDALTGRRRRRRLGEGEPRPGVARIQDFGWSIRADGTLELTVVGAGAARSFRYLTSVSSMPTFAAVVTSGEISNSVDGSPVVAQDAGSDVVVGRAQQLFARVVIFPLLNGAGTAGESVTAKVGPPGLWDPQILSTTAVQIGDGDVSPFASARRSWDVNTRAVALRVYRREGDWPTKVAGDPNAELDPVFDRGIIDQDDQFAYEDGGWQTDQVVYDIAVPVDTNGLEYPGNRSSNSLTIVGGGGTGDPYFTIKLTRRVEDQPGTSCTVGQRRQVELFWDIANCVAATDSVEAWRRIDGDVWELLTTTSDPCAIGSYLDQNTPCFEQVGSAILCKLDYKIVLLRSGVEKDSRVWNDPLDFERSPLVCPI